MVYYLLVKVFADFLGVDNVELGEVEVAWIHVVPIQTLFFLGDETLASRRCPLKRSESSIAFGGSCEATGWTVSDSEALPQSLTSICFPE